MKKKKKKKRNIVKNLQTNKNFSGFPNISRTNTRNKFNCPRIFINLQSYLKVISYVLNNSFSYTQLSFLFVLQKNSYYVHDDTDAFFLFLLQKDFHIFCVIMYYVFDIYLSFLYIEKDLRKIFSLVFSYV